MFLIRNMGFWIVASLIIAGCNKEPGPGGKATIKGNIYSNNYCEESGTLQGQTGATGQRVYISYGGGQQYDDDVRAGSNGYFEFKFMNPGTYRLSVLSECLSCPGGTEEVSTKIEVGKNDKDVTVGRMDMNTIANRFCSGPGSGGVAAATGQLNVIYIDRGTLDTLGTGPRINERVFLIYGTGSTHSDDMRSSTDGSYLFSELRPGNYRVFAYSECDLCPEGVNPEFVDFSVAESDSLVTIPTLTVLELKN